MSTDRPSPQMHDDEVPIDDALVRALLKDQFPELAGRRVMRIADSGTDNAIFRLGDDLGLRLPRIHWAEAQIEKEVSLAAKAGARPARPGAGSAGPGSSRAWLPVSVAHLPMAGGYEPGSCGGGELRCPRRRRRPVRSRTGADSDRWRSRTKRRGAPMAQFDEAVRWGIRQLDGLVDTARAQRVWESALAAGELAGGTGLDPWRPVARERPRWERSAQRGHRLEWRRGG